MLIYFVQDKATDTADLSTEGNGGASAHEHEGDGYDSDATVLYKTPECGSPGSIGSTSVESTYIMDPDYSGPGPQSQPCMRCGICYTPIGMTIYVKQRKLDYSGSFAIDGEDKYAKEQLCSSIVPTTKT
jgi:hypothetical protein